MQSREIKVSSYSSIPSSVYRLQLSEQLSLRQATELLAYLNDLGIDGVYLSPIFESVSSHGYDVTNPTKLNPVLGTADDYEQFCETLKKYEMSQVLDVVPNHMGIKGSKNEWWLDVLKYGSKSTYAPFFDIDWLPAKRELEGKVLLPILGDVYGTVLENQEIQLQWKDPHFWISYGDYHLPVTPSSYSFILKHASSLRESKEELIALFNGKKGEAKSFDLLHRLLEKQYYRLAHWIVAGEEINYRRFFNINELIAIHIEKEHVLNSHHRWVFDLIESGKVQGLRIDHPDGLYNPTQYFDRLKTKKPFFIVAEKILDFKEPLPEKWDIDGTVGYDFLNIVNGVFIQKKNEKIFERIYEEFIGEKIDFDTLLYERRKWFIKIYMSGEIHSLGWRLERLVEKSRYTRDFTRRALIDALQEVIACFAVYRTYILPDAPISKKDRYYVIDAIEKAKAKTPQIAPSLYNYLRDLLLLEIDYEGEEKSVAEDFLLRFEQLTAPVMAKSLEDSSYYIYNRFISLNEVGSNPKNFGFSRAEFHQFNKEKLKNYPIGFLATSTHDTKRSEDFRMRLNVLSEMPKQWQEKVCDWHKRNLHYKTKIDGVLFPDSNMEYYLYQMLLGMWPQEEQESASATFKERLERSFLKALREAGVVTSWLFPSVIHEEAARKFLLSIISKEGDFLEDFLNFQKKLDHFGSLNSLSELLLKIGSCGIVDIYQGNESWDYSSVDPDNRRQIDYAAKQKALGNVMRGPLDPQNLKLFATYHALNFRKSHKALFLKGEYCDLSVQGEREENAIAFLRKYESQCALIIVGRFFAQFEGISWEKTIVVLPKEFEGKEFEDIFTKVRFKVQKRGGEFVLFLSDLFATMPCALLGLL